MTRKPRPKVKAAAQGGTATAIAAALLTWLLDAAGVDVDALPAGTLVLAAGLLVSAAATAAAYLRRDGLAGAWHRIVHGVSAPNPGP